MKKLVTLLLAAGLVFSAANNASAVEVKASGSMDFAFQFSQNIQGGNTGLRSFMDTQDAAHNGFNQHQKHFEAVQRFRLGLDFIMSENLSAHYAAQVGIFTWGGPSSGLDSGQGGNANENLGGALGSRAANIVTRLAYLDWMIPNTDVKVRMGQQAVALPSFTFGSPVLDDTATGIVVAAPFNENVGLTAMWLRAESDSRRGTSASTGFRTDDNIDLFGAIVDLKFDGFALQPWAVVGTVGKSTGWKGVAKNSVAWFAGFSGELTMFDPFRLTADFFYSAMDGEKDNRGSDISGWYAALGAEYKTVYGTPALKGFYSSGDSDRTGTHDRNEIGRPIEVSGGFNATNTFYSGRFGIANTPFYSSPNGAWGISAQWNGLSFIENLSHDMSVTYVQGTNNKHNAGIFGFPNSNYLTTKDSLVEIDFTTKYQIYQNLATALELGYIIEDFDGKNIAHNMGRAEKYEFSNAWRAALNFQYKF